MAELNIFHASNSADSTPVRFVVNDESGMIRLQCGPKSNAEENSFIMLLITLLPPSGEDFTISTTVTNTAMG